MKHYQTQLSCKLEGEQNESQPHGRKTLQMQSEQAPKPPKLLTAKTLKHRIITPENLDNHIGQQTPQVALDNKLVALKIRLNTTKLIAQPIRVLYEIKRPDNRHITTAIERETQLNEGLCFNRQSYSEINKNGLSRQIDVLKYIDLCRGVAYDLQPNGLCKSKNCPVRREWVQLLRSQMETDSPVDAQQTWTVLQNSAICQIKNDTLRTFNEALIMTCQIDIKHVHYLERTLKQVLISYAKIDTEVEYVQGMNFIAGAIVNHLRQLNISSRMFEFVMTKHGLRDLYLKQFNQLKEHCEQLYHRHLKNVALDIYQHLSRQNIQPITFLPPWFLSLFSCLVPINYMHLVIDGYIASGFAFVYRLALCYIIFLRSRIMVEKDEAIIILGSSYSRQLQICWPELIAASERVPLL